MEIAMNPSLRCSKFDKPGRCAISALRVLAALVFLVFSAAELQAATVTLAWDSNPEPDIAGYVISYGTQSGTYTTSVDVGNVTTWSVNLTAGQRYYFVAQAYNTSAQQSARSAEVFIDVGASAGPSITSLSPTSGAVGAAITINGTNFGATQGTSTVQFNGTVATPASWNTSSIVVPVPNGATTGNVVVTVGGVSSSGVPFTVTASAPSITNLSPTSGVVGAAITINGANFGATQGTGSVRFNGTVAAPTSWNASSIVVPVPSGATTGNVVVTANSLASNGVPFTVTASAPSITGLSPTSGTVGTAVTISGANFGTTQGTSSVRFNGTLATPTSWAASSIVVPVPTGATTGNVVVTANSVASNGVPFTLTSSTLPAPWLSQDVGGPAIAGQASYSAGTFSLSAGGVDIWDVADQFRFVYQPIDGDGQVVAFVGSMQSADAWTKAGVMIREDLTAGARNAMVEASAANGMVFQSRVSPGGVSTSIKSAGAVPRWVRLVRSGTTLSGYQSTDGTAWTSMGSFTIAMATRVYVGLALTSHNAAGAASATFSSVAVTSGAANRAPTLTQPANQTNAEGSTVSVQLVASDPDSNPLTYTATGLPASLSVNTTTGVISGTLTFTSAGSYSVTATASDGTLSDSKTFSWTVSDVPQGPSITSLSPTSGTVGTVVTISGANFGASQGTGSVRFNGTVAAPTSWNTSSIVVPVPSGATTGNVVVTANSLASNGVPFTVTASAPSITSLSPTSGTVGTAVTISGANFGTTQGTSNVRFNGTVATPTSWAASSIIVPVPTGATTGNVVVTVNSVASNGVPFTVTTSTTLPAPWLSQDVGGPAIAGQASYSAGTFSLSAGGVDIWGVADQFRFVYQPIDGDGQVVAFVGSMQSADAWTKAGVMIREDLTAGSTNVMVSASAANGMVFQSRVSRGGVTTSLKLAGTVPHWVRLVRSGSTLTGYHSTDGTTWTLMGSSTIAMATRVYVGLALVSHNAAASASATFSSVTVTGSTTQSLTAMTAMATSTPAVAGGQLTAKQSLVSARRPNRVALSDYDGDGRSDIATYRPSTGAWRTLASGSNLTSGTTVRWGTATDVPVPGDYDGDRKTDIAFYRPSTGTWSVLLTSGSNYTSHFDVVLGGDGDVPVPGDYDGDGITDMAVYSPATGQWWILKSSTNYTTVTTMTWGSGSDVPVPGDYDGDGKTDLAVYRPSSGEWKILQSRTDFATDVTLVLGSGPDIPVAADYDGDGIADVAVFQPSTGMWIARLSSAGFAQTTLATLGANGDIPVAGDYDGDGRADLAVFHAGTWKVLLSGADYTSGVSTSWGQGTDVPLPARR
jgi:regulation of enolase protein 1 (concanavalin A-like superfamily)